MTESAAHLVDHVLPPLPVRQWVLAVPKRLRYFLERDAALQGATLRLFLRAVEQCLRGHSAGAGATARLGAVVFVHRFGATLNAHLHFHCVVIDGVFAPTATGGAVFHPATALDGPAIATVQAKVRRRLLQRLVRRGLLAEDDAQARAQWDHGGGFSVDASVRIEAADRAGRGGAHRTRPKGRSKGWIPDPFRSVMTAPQSPPCGTNFVYPRRFISTTQARAMWGQSHPVVVGLPEYP